MAIQFHPDDSIETLYKNVHAVGIPTYAEKADRILEEYGQKILMNEKSMIRLRMFALLAHMEWELGFTPEAKAEREKIFRGNFGIAA